MTTPARDRPGPLAIAMAFAANGTVEARDLLLRSGAGNVAFVIRSSQPGDISIMRVDGFGREFLHVPVINYTPTADDDGEVFEYLIPASAVRVRFTNTNATPGIIDIDAGYGGQGSAGR